MKKNTAPVRWALAVYALVRDARGHILFLRRSQSKTRFSRCWELPGGKPDAGETFDATVVREVFEESGLRVKPTDVAGATAGFLPGVRVAMLVLEARPRNTKVTLSAEHDDFRWLPLGQVCSLKLRPGFDQFFASYAAISQRRPPQKPVAELRQ